MPPVRQWLSSCSTRSTERPGSDRIAGVSGPIKPHGTSNMSLNYPMVLLMMRSAVHRYYIALTAFACFRALTRRLPFGTYSADWKSLYRLASHGILLRQSLLASLRTPAYSFNVIRFPPGPDIGSTLTRTRSGVIQPAEIGWIRWD